MLRMMAPSSEFLYHFAFTSYKVHITLYFRLSMKNTSFLPVEVKFLKGSWKRTLTFTLHLWSTNCFSSDYTHTQSHTLFHIIFVTPHEVGIYSLQIRTLKVTEVKQSAYHPKASKWHRLDCSDCFLSTPLMVRKKPSIAFVIEYWQKRFDIGYLPSYFPRLRADSSEQTMINMSPE